MKNLTTPFIRSTLASGALAVFLAANSTAASAPLVDVHSVAPSIHVDLQYNSPKNAFGKRLYRSNVALLREPVAHRLARVEARLRKSGLGLKIWDAYRPTSVQAQMWSLNRQSHSRYLANPKKGSKHSRGAAVDVTLVDEHGHELQMPTGHDDFTVEAHRGATRGIPAKARHNWHILDHAMRSEGFIPNQWEWWHFTSPDWNHYPLSNAPLSR